MAQVVDWAQRLYDAADGDLEGLLEMCHEDQQREARRKAGGAVNFDAERIEARSVAFTDVDTSKDGWSFEGLAAVYDQETDLGQYTESMARGSYRKVLSRGDNVPMLHDHNVMLPVLATTGGGTLKLADDAKGLRVKADIAKHFVGEAVRELVSRGDIRGMSVGFIAGSGNSRVESRGGKLHRTLTDFKKLLDVSPTWEPAYAGTSAELRSLRALQMAEDVDQAQQLLTGAVPQPEDGAQVDETAEPGESEAEKDPETCDKCGESLVADVEHSCVEDEQRSGAPADDVAAAARRRRLHMMGLTLPKDLR
jgi:HK97 family phage prohead protease